MAEGGDLLLAAGVCALAALAIWAALRERRVHGAREGFVSPRARLICEAARAGFSAGDFSFAGFLARAGAGADADAASHAAARRLWRRGLLSPEALEAAGA